mgnify:FL=1
MITKFECRETKNTVEFQREMDTILLNIQSYENRDDYQSATLSEQDLFNLIGQLLRMQAEIKKEVSHG